MANPSKTFNSSKKTRAFSLITYCNKKQIVEVLGSHNSSIRAFAYIYHDQDETTPHYHVVFRTFDAWSIPQIEKWWKGFTDEKGQEINTFVQQATDLHALKEYLTHSDAESRAAGKHLYNSSDIISVGLFDLVSKKDAVDDTLEIVDHMVYGASTRWLIRRYGKAFVYHFSQFCAVREAIESEMRMELAKAYDASIKQEKSSKSTPIPLDNVCIEELLK